MFTFSNLYSESIKKCKNIFLKYAIIKYLCFDYL